MLFLISLVGDKFDFDVQQNVMDVGRELSRAVKTGRLLHCWDSK